jgi:hypothetical protein
MSYCVVCMQGDMDILWVREDVMLFIVCLRGRGYIEGT